MASKKAFPLRLDPGIYDAVRRLADAELRSVNSQIEFLLREALTARGLSPKPGRSGPGSGRKGRATAG